MVQFSVAPCVYSRQSSRSCCCHCTFSCSGNIIIETKFFDSDLQVSVSNVRIFYIWLSSSSSSSLTASVSLIIYVLWTPFCLRFYVCNFQPSIFRLVILQILTDWETIVWLRFARLTAYLFCSYKSSFSGLNLAMIASCWRWNNWTSFVVIEGRLYKLAPYGTDGRLLLTANFKVTWHKKTGTKIKNPAPISCRYCALV